MGAWRKCPMKLGLKCLVRGHCWAGLVPLRSQKVDLAELGLRPQRRRSYLLWWWSLRSSEGDPPTELGPTSLRSGHFQAVLVPSELSGSPWSQHPDLWRVHCPINAGTSGAHRRIFAELRPRSLKMERWSVYSGISEGGIMSQVLGV